MRKFLLLAVIAFGLTADAQDAMNFEIAPLGTVNPSEVKVDRNTNIQHIEAPYPGTDPYRVYLSELKSRILQRQQNTWPSSVSNKTDGIGDPPTVGQNFQGNEFEGVPNDNDMAISNDGKLVSVTNSMIYIFDVVQDTLLLAISLEAFTDSTVGLPARKFDPRVTYDFQQDRFIMAYLSGNRSTDNGIVLAFSETNDPMGNWNMYALPGNPFNDSTWSDYPMMEIADGRLLLTVNQIRDGVSWQLGFTQSIIWQIDKATGYAGSNLSTRMYSGIEYGGKPLRNLTPVENDRAASSGSGFIFLSNRNFDTINDTIWVVEVLSDISDPTPQIDVDFSITDQVYGVPPNAHQPSNRFLQTNDGRILDAISENGEIHFVGNTNNPANNRAAIFHGVLYDLPNNGTKLDIISDDSLEFGYPAIAYSGRFDGDVQFIMTFNHSSETVNPGLSTMHWDQFTGLSERVMVKEGTSFINTQSGNVMRWGDYSGAQAKGDEPGKVWICGYWGKFDPPQGTITYRNNSTWIAEVESPGSPSVGIEDVEAQESKAMAFPNPTSGRFSVEFEVPNSEVYFVKMFDLKGQLVEILFADKIKEGQNVLSFNTEGLEAGAYIIEISNNADYRSTLNVLIYQ